MRQIEQMESEELMTQKKLRTEVIQLEDMLAQVRKEYEMLRIEFEQNLAANEQTGPINKEMRNLIQSLQTHNVQVCMVNGYVIVIYLYSREKTSFINWKSCFVVF